MDEASLQAIAARVAGGEMSPPTDALSELVELVAGCRRGIDRMASDYMEGRLSEEAYSRLSGGVYDAARSACDSMRSRKAAVESVLSGRSTP